jgi:hypothetical protein
VTARLVFRSKWSTNSFGGCLISIGVLFAGPVGCTDDSTSLPPTDFGSPPPDLPPVPPSNEASPSTNVSTYPVVSLDDPSCSNATRAIFAFYDPGRHVHLHTNDFNEGMSGGYQYQFPMNLFVEPIPGTIPVYRCHPQGQESTHYLSTDVNCEGGVSEDADDPILGYLYSPDSPQPPHSRSWYRSSNGADHYIHDTATPLQGWTLDKLMGYGPSLACKNLATTCQPYPSHYTGYAVNPHLNPDTGAYVRYSDRAPNPPWFGAYGRANQSGSSSDAILTGDWGTTNNVDWAPNRKKAECGYTDWMTGLSSDPSHKGAPHAFRCGMSEYHLGARTFNGNCKTLQAENMGSAGAGAFRNRHADWDVGYTKYSCTKGSYLAGVSSNHNDWSHLDGILCCSEPDLSADDCTTVVFGQTSPEEHTSVTTDENDNIVPYDWDPQWEKYAFQKAECGAGRRMMGASKDKDNKLHAILCCRTPSAPPARANVSCCSPQTLQRALANCNADNDTYESDCENIVAPCCNSDPGSDGFGGAMCAAVSTAMRADASAPDGDPNSTVAGSTSNGESSCGTSGAPAAWSFGYSKKGGGGNRTFGGGYTGDVALAAGPIYANGAATVVADASLFGKRLDLARAELHGNITDNDPLTARIVVLGMDLYVYPHAGASQKSPFDSASMTHEVHFFESTEVIFLFALPITIRGTIAGEVGVTASVQSGGNTLSFNATPMVGATATCSAAIGGGKGGFRLTAGVEGSLNLFHAYLGTTAKVSPFTTHVNYNIHSDLQVTSMDGWIRAFLKAQLKPLFKKTFKQTLASWGGVKQTIPLFSYNGCMSY